MGRRRHRRVPSAPRPLVAARLRRRRVGAIGSYGREGLPDRRSPGDRRPTRSGGDEIRPSCQGEERHVDGRRLARADRQVEEIRPATPSSAVRRRAGPAAAGHSFLRCPAPYRRGLYSAEGAGADPRPTKTSRGNVRHAFVARGFLGRNRTGRSPRGLGRGGSRGEARSFSTSINWASATNGAVAGGGTGSRDRRGASRADRGRSGQAKVVASFADVGVEVRGDRLGRQPASLAVVTLNALGSRCALGCNRR